MIQSNSSKSKTTFNLLKYSRGRVPENDQQDDFSQSQSQSQPPSSSQFQSSQPPPNSNSNSSIPIKWEHFTHPVLTCSVEQTFASTPTAQKAAQSLLVNIQWRISSTDRMTLEDIDLLAFTASNFPANSQDEVSDSNLVKAVLRGKIVGFKYAHLPKPNSIERQYRRFQLKFSEESSAQSFVALIQNVCPVIVKAAAPSPKKENSRIVNPKTHTFTKSDDESFIGSSSPLENLASSPTLKERSSSSMNNSRNHRYSPPASPLHSIGKKVHSEIPSISSSYPMTNFSNGSGASKSTSPSSLGSLAGGANQTTFNASRSETLPISQFSSASQRSLQSASVHSLKTSAPTYSKIPFPWRDTQQSQSLDEDVYSQISASQPSLQHQKRTVDNFSSYVVDEETFADTSFIEASQMQVVKPKAKSGFQSPLKKKPRLDPVEETVASTASSHSHTQEQVQVQERGSSPPPLDVGMKLSSSRSISLSPSSPVHRSSSPALRVELNSSVSPSSQTSRPRPPLFIPSNSQSQTSLSLDTRSSKSQIQNPFFLVEGERARGSQSSEREIRKIPERFLSSQQQRQQSAVFRSASSLSTPKEVQSEVLREDSRNVLTSGIDSLDQLASIPTTIPQLDTSNMDFTDFQSQMLQKPDSSSSVKTGIEAALNLDDKQLDDAVSGILDSSDFVSLCKRVEASVARQMNHE